jgi:hypothetical protein
MIDVHFEIIMKMDERLWIVEDSQTKRRTIIHPPIYLYIKAQHPCSYFKMLKSTELRGGLPESLLHPDEKVLRIT